MGLSEQRQVAARLFGETARAAVATGGRVFAVTNSTPFVASDFILAESTEWKDRCEHMCVCVRARARGVACVCVSVCLSVYYL